MSDVKLGSWSVAESPVTIEYSLVAIEEIRHAVAEGFQRLSRGGIEVGGVLYGTHDGQTVRITTTRPIACEHARGPAFLLSDRDRVELHEQLRRERQDPRLEGMVSVGWYLSHTRSEVMLSEFDQEIYSIFFPEPWQVTLVIHPVRGGNMRAGFFVREAGGTVKSDHSHLEFSFPERLPGGFPERPPRERDLGSPGASAVEQRRPGPLGTLGFDRPEYPPHVPSFGIPAGVGQRAFEPQLRKAPEASRRWIAWLVLAIAALAGVVLGLRYLMLRSGPDPLALTVVEREGQLQIEWNRTAKSVEGAKSGGIDIADGTDTRTIQLTPKILAGGKIFYVRKTGDVEIRMTVEEPDGSTFQEASRFLGLPPAAAPANTEELTVLEKRRDELEAELRRVRQQNDAQAARIQQLERTLRILETRLNIDQARQR
jgi:proteasome lid subunit RPN8/RPN11